MKLTHSYDRFPLDSEHFLTYRLTGGDTSALRTGFCAFSIVKNSSSLIFTDLHFANDLILCVVFCLHVFFPCGRPMRMSNIGILRRELELT